MPSGRVAGSAAARPTEIKSIVRSVPRTSVQMALGKDEDAFGGVGLRQPGGDRLALGDDRLGRLEDAPPPKIRIERAPPCPAPSRTEAACFGLDIAKTVERQTK